MGTGPTRISTFSLFPYLPFELRNQIWRDALPERIEPTLYFYRDGCWPPRQLTPPDNDFDHRNEYLTITFKSRQMLRGNVQLEMPLFFVNREARKIALAWIRANGIKMRAGTERQPLVFAHPFSPVRDVLFIAAENRDEFLSEPDNRMFEGDLLAKFTYIQFEVTRVAITEALLRSEATAAFADILYRYFHRIEVLYIIVDAQPDSQHANNDMKVQRRWELESRQGGSLFWNHESGEFDGGDGEKGNDKRLVRLLREAQKGFCEELARNHFHSFEIRPVFTVRG